MMTRSLIAVLLGASLALGIAGCAKKTEQTRAVEVKNPPAETAPQPKAAPPQPTPEPPKTEVAEPAAKTSAAPKGFTKTESGLMYKDKKVGKGTAAKPGDTVSVHYKGWLDNGTVFDTSRKPERGPFGFTLGAGQVIRGWDEGVAGMKPGGVRELIIPPDLGYGERGMGQIPPNSTLHFDVELLKIGG